MWGVQLKAKPGPKMQSIRTSHPPYDFLKTPMSCKLTKNGSPRKRSFLDLLRSKILPRCFLGLPRSSPISPRSLDLPSIFPRSSLDLPRSSSSSSIFRRSSSIFPRSSLDLETRTMCFEGGGHRARPTVKFGTTHYAGIICVTGCERNSKINSGHKTCACTEQQRNQAF